MTPRPGLLCMHDTNFPMLTASATKTLPLAYYVFLSQPHVGKEQKPAWFGQTCTCGATVVARTKFALFIHLSTAACKKYCPVKPDHFARGENGRDAPFAVVSGTWSDFLVRPHKQGQRLTVANLIGVQRFLALSINLAPAAPQCAEATNSSASLVLYGQRSKNLSIFVCIKVCR